MRRLIAIAALVAMLVPRTAHPFAWSSPLGRLLEQATVIEIVEVEAVRSASWDVRITESIRGATTGSVSTIHSDVADLPRASVGQRFLVVCDRDMCPRAVGLESGSAFVLQAFQPLDVASVQPPVVNGASIADLAAGRGAPDVCIHIDVALSDEAGTAPRVDLAFGASDASRLRATTTFASAMPAILGVGSSTDRDAARLVVGLGLHDAHRLRSLMSVGAMSRDVDGCLRGAAVIAYPAARTVREFTAVLTDPAVDVTIAIGSVVVSHGSSLRHGASAASIVVTTSGYVELRVGGRSLRSASDVLRVQRRLSFGGVSIILPALSGWDFGGEVPLICALVHGGPQRWSIVDDADTVIGFASMRRPPSRTNR